MKRRPLFLIALFLLLMLSACGGKDTGSAPSDRPPQPPEESAQSGQSGNPEETEPNGAAPPYEIAGLYFSRDGSAPMYIEPVGERYAVFFDGYESQLLTSEYDAVTDAVNLSGEVKVFPGGGAPSEGNWRMTAHIDRIWGTSASLTIIDVATNDQNTRVDGSFQKFLLHDGTYFYWDRAVKEKKNLMELEYEKGRFRFTVAERYVSDWLEPTSSQSNSCAFSYLPGQDTTGEHGTVQLDISLNSRTDYNDAMVRVCTGDGTGVLLHETAYAISSAEALPDRTGTYGPDPDADEAHTVVVEPNRLTIDDRYTAELIPEDLVIGGWRTIAVTEIATGAQQDANVFFQPEDGDAVSLAVSLYDEEKTFRALRP